MNRKTLISASILAALSSGPVMADFPNVVIDTEIVLDYNETINMKNAVNIPTASDLPNVADVSINQFNHESGIDVAGEVLNNVGAGETLVNITGVGNNAVVDVSLNESGSAVGAVQGNQVSPIDASVNVERNTIIEGSEVIVELTAVGNNLSIENELGGTTVGSIQFNYDSGITAVGAIDNNGFGVAAPVEPPAPTPPPPPAPRPDPALTITAVGNNLVSVAPTIGSMTQINRNSPIVASGSISGNIGSVGPISLDVTAVGNNISVSQPGSDE